MNILTVPISYREGIPCEANLCRVDRAYPHMHAHDLEIVFCLKGNIHLVASDQAQTLSAGQIHSIDYRDIHYLYSDEDNLALIFHLDLKNIPYEWEQIRYVFFACESNHCYAYQRDAMEAVKSMILSFSYDYLTENHAPEDYAGPVEFFSFYLLQYFNWFNYENQDEYMNEDLYERFHRVLAYCIDHYDQKISISQLAAAEHISKNYFSQFISHTIFKSFSTMIKYIRCYEAEHLLLTTDKPNAEIAYECGFSDPKYFYSAFRELWGCTPSEDRQRYAAYVEECLEHLERTEGFSGAPGMEDAGTGGARKTEETGAADAQGMEETGAPGAPEAGHDVGHPETPEPAPSLERFHFQEDEVPGETVLPAGEAAAVLREYTASWHLEKVFNS